MFVVIVIFGIVFVVIRGWLLNGKDSGKDWGGGKGNFKGWEEDEEVLRDVFGGIVLRGRVLRGLGNKVLLCFFV